MAKKLKIKEVKTKEEPVITDGLNEVRKEYFNKINFPDEIKKYLYDKNVTEILIRYGFKIWIVTHDKGKINTNETVNAKELESMIYQASNYAETTYNQSSPILDVGYKDDNVTVRINAIDESVTGQHIVSIRKVAGNTDIELNYLVESGYMPERVATLLKILTIAGANFCMCGQTNAGKSKLLQVLSEYIQGSVATIEDTPELNLNILYPTRNIIELKINDYASYTECIKACLRQNPEAILVSEARGEEVIELINALTSGHQGFTTTHTRSAAAVPERMRTIAKADELFEESVYENIDYAVFIKLRNVDGVPTREIFEVVEFIYDEKSEQKCQVNPIYTKKFTKDGKAIHLYGELKNKYMIQSLLHSFVDNKSLYAHLEPTKFVGENNGEKRVIYFE